MPHLRVQVSDELAAAIAEAAIDGEKTAATVRRLLAKALKNKALAEVPPPGRPWPKKKTSGKS